MIIVEPKVEILDFNASEIMARVETIGRVCYKSEERITQDSSKTFISNLISRGHEAMLEHASLSIKFTCDRGVSHELVRHRLVAFAQESTRYCNYSKTGEVKFIRPVFFIPGSPEYVEWSRSCKGSEQHYLKLLEMGKQPQEARDSLNNSTKTEIWMTANLREWRHILTLRAYKAAHPQMRQLMIPTLRWLKENLPIIFGDISYDLYPSPRDYACLSVIEIGG